MIRSLAVIRSFIAVAVLAASLISLGVDLAQTAYTVAHTARTVVLTTS
jgi:hypothetical protein